MGSQLHTFHSVGFVMVVLVLKLSGAMLSLAADPAIDEQFRSLDDWEDLEFDDIDRRTDYSIVEEEGHSLLFIESASGRHYFFR